MATVRRMSDTGVTVRFDDPVLAPAPGQAAVIYQGDRVIAGGWIVKSL
jgi:tRNA-uridine 2-sulfurtransferase